MEEFNKKIENFRRVLEEIKAERYKLAAEGMAKQDEYLKSLYIRVLCTLVQYENEPAQMQLLLLKRFIKGLGLEEPLEDCMRKALEISEEELQEFLSLAGERDVRFYFAVDGALLLALGGGAQAGYAYLAELIELLGVERGELEYLCLVARAVLQQQSSFFDEAKAKRTERVHGLDFSSYIGSFYAGAVVDTDTEKHYFAPSKELSKSMVFPTAFQEKRVVFENCDFSVGENWEFHGCEEVIFKNCSISGDEFHLSFKSVGLLLFENCRVKGFSNRFAIIESVDNLEIIGCLFSDCGFKDTEGDCNHNDGYLTGGIFFASESYPSTIKIEKNQLLTCYIETDCTGWGDCCLGGALIGFLETRGTRADVSLSFLSVIDNEFIGCDFRNQSTYCGVDKDYKSIISYCVANQREIRDNRFTGNLKRLCNNNNIR